MSAPRRGNVELEAEFLSAGMPRRSRDSEVRGATSIAQSTYGGGLAGEAGLHRAV
jgi:hypothetical protein